MLKRPLRKATRARVVRTALLLSVWQREVKIEGVRLQGALHQCAAVTRCLEVGDMGEGSVTAPGVKHGEMSGMGNLQP